METEAKTIKTEQPEETRELESEKEINPERSPLRSRSRSPLQRDEANDKDGADSSVSEEISNNDDSTSTTKYIPPSKRPIKDQNNRALRSKVVLHNIPNSWTYEDIKNYIKSAVNSQYVASNVGYVSYRKTEVPMDELGKCSVTFHTDEAAYEACARLKEVELNGRSLEPEIVLTKDKNVKNKNKPEVKAKPVNDNVNKPVLKLKIVQTTNNTYGLDLQYLNSLGLIPPLQSRIMVHNLDPCVDVEKMKEIFSLAGRIVDIQKLKKSDGTPKNSVKIEYDHPVEAVQAVSMFRNQKLYNKVLIVKMETNTFPYKRPIPMGLSGMGPGLGENGEPLPYVRAHVELQTLKEQIKKLSTELERNSKLQQNVPTPTTTPTVPDPNVPAVSLLNDLLKMCQRNTGQMNALNPQGAIPSTNVPHQVPQRPMEQNMNHFNAPVPVAPVPTTPTVVPNANWQLQANAPSNPTIQDRTYSAPYFAHHQAHDYGQSMTNSNIQSNEHKTYSAPPPYSAHNQATDYGQSISNTHIQSNEHKTYSAPYSVHNQASNYGQGTSSSNNDNYKKNNTRNYKDPPNVVEDYRNKCGDIIVFKNLPSSVTVEALRAKMSEVGALRSVEMTGPGKAMVRFVREKDAEKCIKLFDRSKVDGHVIIARYF